MPETGTPSRPQSELEPSKEVARSGRSESSPGNVEQSVPQTVPEGEVIEETREIKRLLYKQFKLLTQRMVHIGPIPSAEDYKEYEAVLAGSADRILKMAESEQAHGQRMDGETLAADTQIARRGQNYAPSATVILGFLGAALGFGNHDWLGGAFVVSSLVPIVAHFLGRGAAEPRKKQKPDQPQVLRSPQPAGLPREPSRSPETKEGKMDVVERAGLHSADLGSPTEPQRVRSALELANEVLENPGLWLRTPNPRLDDRQPIELIGTEEELKVYNILNAVNQGLF